MKLGVTRCAITGAGTLMTIFLLCWLGTLFTRFAATHMFISLFTAAPPESGLALASGLCAALVFGAVTGALLALIYNVTDRWFGQ